jgi:hypothetical protein
MLRDEAGDRGGIAERQQRQGRRERHVRGDRHDMGIVGIEERLAERWPMHLELGMGMVLMRATNSSSAGSATPRNSCMSAQRRAEATMTSLAPASRWRHESLPGRSISNSWWACLIVDTVRPRAARSGMSAVNSVVLPLPLQPARPKMRIPRYPSR